MDFSSSPNGAQDSDQRGGDKDGVSSASVSGNGRHGNGDHNDLPSGGSASSVASSNGTKRKRSARTV